MRPVSLAVVGDALLDRDVDGCVERLCPDAPVPVVECSDARDRPGGAALAAALAALDGHDVTFVTAIGPDESGDRLRELLRQSGVRLVDIGEGGTTPLKTRVRAGGRTLLRFDRSGEQPSVRMTTAVTEAIRAARAVLVSDYGRGVTADVSLRHEVQRAARRRPTVWDPHPRGAEPVRQVRVATPNEAEVGTLAQDDPAGSPTGSSTPSKVGSLGALTARASALRRRWGAAGVALTLGERGVLYLEDEGAPLMVPAPPVTGCDSCGAGDRFASAVAAALGDGALPSESVRSAVARASAFVAAGGAASVRADGIDLRADGHHLDGAAPVAVARAVRSRGGTVVATGGCFDLVHAGHIALLQAARRLGDCLIVCLNSDESVRRIKGPGRPIVPERDRRTVLASLACVDGVEVFAEDTPVQALERIQPHIWAKGADYAGASLPEAAVLERWGGQAVVVPYLAGRSTTDLVEEVVNRARH